jgi:predicted membrane-bound mannosyltransferase
MNRKQILQFHPQLQLLLQRLRIVNLSLIALVIILYSISFYCLLKEQMVVAISLATFTAIVFHLSQKQLLSFVKYWLSQDSKNKEMLAFIDKEIEVIRARNSSRIQKNNAVKEFFALLEKALEIIDT